MSKSLVLNEDIWCTIIEFACGMPSTLMLAPDTREGARTYFSRNGRWRRLDSYCFENHNELIVERANIRSVCMMFARILRRIQIHDPHIVIPGCRPTAMWLERQTAYPFLQPKACDRWSIRDMIFNTTKRTIMKEAWSRINNLRQLDVEVAPDFKESLVTFSIELAYTASEFIRRNSSTLEVVHWFTPSVDIVPHVRIAAASLVNLDILLQNSYINHPDSLWKPITWVRLRYLRIQHDFSPIPTRILHVLSLDDMPNLESLTVASYARVFGLDEFLEKNKGLKKVVLDTRMIMSNEQIPSCPHLEELEGRILPLLMFVRREQPSLRSMTLRGLFGYDSTSARTRMVFQLEHLVSVMAQGNNLPALSEVRLHNVPGNMLQDGCWLRKDMKTIVKVANTLILKNIKLKTSDGKHIKMKAKTAIAAA